MGRVWCVLLAAAWLALGVVPCSAQNYPTRPCASWSDSRPEVLPIAIARIVRQIYPTNSPTVLCGEIGGAGGNTAAGQVARAAPDGYTIMAISTGFVVNPPVRQGAVRSHQGFCAGDAGAVSPNVVVVNPTVPAKSLPELVQFDSRQSGKYSFAGPGCGLYAASGGANCSAGVRSSTWYHVPFTGRRACNPGDGGGHYSDRFSRPSRPHSRRYRAGSCARSVLPRTDAARDAGCGRSPNRGVKRSGSRHASTGIVAPAGTPKEAMTCFIERPPTLSGNRR